MSSCPAGQDKTTYMPHSRTRGHRRNGGMYAVCICRHGIYGTAYMRHICRLVRRASLLCCSRARVAPVSSFAPYVVMCVSSRHTYVVVYAILSAVRRSCGLLSLSRASMRAHTSARSHAHLAPLLLSLSLRPLSCSHEPTRVCSRTCVGAVFSRPRVLTRTITLSFFYEPLHRSTALMSQHECAHTVHIPVYICI
jgi:hypothetical protein